LLVLLLLQASTQWSDRRADR